MKKELAQFTTYTSMADARPLIDILEEHQIEFSLVEDAYEVDISFTGNNQKTIQVFMRGEDFDEVRKLQEEKVLAEMDFTDTSHYLHSFSDEELLDILRKKDEWSLYDFVLSKKLLADRGIEISEEAIDQFVNERNQELDAPEKGNATRIIVGYIFASLGGLIGIAIGLYLWLGKKSTTGGERIYIYNENDRYHGKLITFIAICVFAVVLGIRLALFLNTV